MRPLASDLGMQATLKRRVAALCGPDARSVEIKVQPNGQVNLVITVPTTTDIDQLAPRVLGMQEMLLHQVHPEFVVQP